MKRILLAISIGVLMCAAAAAQDGLKGSPPPPVQPDLLVIQFLGMTETQAAQFREYLQEMQRTVFNVQSQVGAMQKNLGVLIEANPPNEAAIGRTLLEIHALELQAGQAIERYHQRFKSLLGPEQMQRAQQVVQARELFPVVGAFAAVNLVPPAQKMEQPPMPLPVK